MVRSLSGCYLFSLNNTIRFHNRIKIEQVLMKSTVCVCPVKELISLGNNVGYYHRSNTKSTLLNATYGG